MDGEGYRQSSSALSSSALSKILDDRVLACAEEGPRLRLSQENGATGSRGDFYGRGRL
jgi:hypothetical protein